MELPIWLGVQIRQKSLNGAIAIAVCYPYPVSVYMSLIPSLIITSRDFCRIPAAVCRMLYACERYLGLPHLNVNNDFETNNNKSMFFFVFLG